MRLLLITIFVFSCAQKLPKSALTDEGKKVEVLKTRPTEECSMQGKVVGINKEGSAELARNDARNQAAKMRATHLWVDQEVPNGAVIKVHASAYICE